MDARAVKCAADGSAFGPCICGIDAGSGLDANGSIDAAAVDASHDASSTLDGDAAASFTAGLPCTADSACTGPGERCTTDAFGSDHIEPTAICVGLSACTVGAACNGGAGACVTLPRGTTACLGACTFDGASGAAPQGCAGKDACEYVSYTRDSSGAVHGLGACAGGCTRDADCGVGNVCQIETAECVATKVTYSKGVGSACSVGDASCLCAPPSRGSASYCSTRCTVGSAFACGTGFTCDSAAPARDATGAPLFERAPTGMLGYCFKVCSTDADCAGMNAYCDVAAGSSPKVCRPGTP